MFELGAALGRRIGQKEWGTTSREGLVTDTQTRGSVSHKKNEVEEIKKGKILLDFKVKSSRDDVS